MARHEVLPLVIKKGQGVNILNLKSVPKTKERFRIGAVFSFPADGFHPKGRELFVTDGK
jgi:hypothetical protein